MEYTLATMNDLPAIKSLLARYHKDTISQEDIPGGFVTTRLSDQQFEDLIVNRKGVTLAKDENGTVKAFALASSSSSRYNLDGRGFFCFRKSRALWNNPSFTVP